ncbi:glycoside hydrolase family 9 protein, partial [Crossiella equi]
MSVLRRLAAAGLPAVLLLAGVPAHAQPAYERVLNGSFAEGKSPWWSSGNTPSAVTDGRLCAQVPAGTTNPWEAMIGQNDVPLEAGQRYTLRLTASADREVSVRAAVQATVSGVGGTLNQAVTLGPTPRTVELSGVSPASTRRGQVSVQAGGASAPYTLCLHAVSLTGGAIPPGGGWDYGSPVRVNQYAYAVDGPKRATVVHTATTPLPWWLRAASGRVVARGQTRVHGADEASGDHLHQADFSGVRTPGEGYVLVVDGKESLPFAVSADPYTPLRRDALAYFLHNRSGIEIGADLVGPAHARPAGHLGVAPNQGDTSVPCLPGTCDYRLDVRGGWYDAGDHGKYVVNGALAAWQLQDLYERATQHGDRASTRDGLLAIPERANGLPDVLDEARWQLEFLLRMQVPAGQPLAGMAHHKIHDAAWTGFPMLPHRDPQPRYLHPPTTAATLNLAAAAAQCARLWQHWDPAFATRCRTAAETAWRAAEANPTHYAPRESTGGGPYDDTDVRDEFSWAAAELYATTRDRAYLPHTTGTLTKAGFSWKDTAGLTDLVVLRHPTTFPLPRVWAARTRLLSLADNHLAVQRDAGYPNPTPDYPWGSTSATANTAQLLATAHDLTGRRPYRDAALESLDYLLGRNALNQSFVTGYGERSSQDQHHRHWSHSLDPTTPPPPPGSLAGGPNPGLQDPVARQNLAGCRPA